MATRLPDRAPERYRLGLWAEALCRLALRLKGYRIVASRFRTPLGEIDIIAHRHGILAMVEVKARGDAATAGGAISPYQRQRLTRAAAAFLARHPRWANAAVRFDAMLVTPGAWPQHIEDAWRG
ncbi:MAG: YraN family protein [Azospirillum sp.]|nr:YraN family protein [Azospirillum sp.]